MRKLIGTALALGISCTVAASASAAPLTFRGTLTGDQEVPVVDSTARGTTSLRVDPGLTEIRYELRVTDGVAVTQAHLHCADAGVSGTVVAFLFGPVNPGVDVSGKLASGTIRNADIIATSDDLCGGTVNNIASLYQAILEGRIYANVHTAAYPGGEIRSQLFP